MRAFTIALLALPFVVGSPIPVKFGIQSNLSVSGDGRKSDAQLDRSTGNAHPKSDQTATPPLLTLENPIANPIAHPKNSFNSDWSSIRIMPRQAPNAPHARLLTHPEPELSAVESASLLVPRTKTPVNEQAFTSTQKECTAILKHLAYDIMRAPQRCRDLQHASTRFFESDIPQDDETGNA